MYYTGCGNDGGVFVLLHHVAARAGLLHERAVGHIHYRQPDDRVPEVDVCFELIRAVQMNLENCGVAVILLQVLKKEVTKINNLEDCGVAVILLKVLGGGLYLCGAHASARCALALSVALLIIVTRAALLLLLLALVGLLLGRVGQHTAAFGLNLSVAVRGL